MQAEASPARRLILASGNAGKLRELHALLAPLGIEAQAQGERGVAAAAEPFDTFVENALAKARHAARLSGWAALADDSGLCCRVLGGAPGVRSARLAGEHATDAANNGELLRLLSGQTDRRAHYRCVVVALRHADDPEPLYAEGRWDGEILEQPQGAGGFGYDSYFWLPDLHCTAAQLDEQRKNQRSHRALAMRAILAQLPERWDW